jgi:flagellar biosynthesis/type III secretory pathway chaperone
MERLKLSAAGKCIVDEKGHVADGYHPAQIAEEAAAALTRMAGEVERLKAENERHREAAEYHVARAERLREALKQIAEQQITFGADGYTISARCKDIARAALEAKP